MTVSPSWIDALVIPDDVIASDADIPAEKKGVAYLAAGRLLEYLRFAERHELPQLGKVRYEAPRVGQALLEALTLYLGGNPEGTERLARLGQGRNREIRFASRLLASVAWADNSDPVAALALLEALDPRTLDPTSRALLLLHIGVRQAEAGRIADALRSSNEAETLAAPLAPSPALSAIKVVASSNRWRFAAMTGHMDPRHPIARATAPALVAADEMRLAAMDEYLTKQFEATLMDPRTVRVTFATQDSIDARLYGALLRAEFLADWETLQETRKALGRYRVLAAMGVRDREPDAAFHLLRRAGDASGLEAATRTYMRVGPLEPIQRLASVVIGTPWLMTERSAVLGVLEQTAELMTSEMAEAAAHRVSVHARSDADDGRGYDFLKAMDALRGVVQVAPAEAISALLASLLDLAEATDGSAELQGIAKVTRAADWSKCDPSVTDRWMEYIADHLADPSDAQYLSLATAFSLIPVRPEPIATMAEGALENRPNLMVAALFVAASQSIPAHLLARIVQIASDELTGIQQQAAQGSFGLGRSIDPAVLLADLLVREPDRSGWRQLVSFATDDKVAWTDRLGVLDYFSQHQSAMPATQRKRLKVFCATTTRPGPAWFIEQSAVEACLLRLGLQLGSFDASEALSRVLALATDGNPSARIAAAQALGAAVDVDSTPAYVTLALALSQDAHHDVRGAGGSALANCDVVALGPLRDLVERRLIALLSDTGTAAPRAVLDGLLVAQGRGRTLTLPLQSAVELLNRRHPSAAIRWRASRLLSMRS